jgi:hypothetical protein
VADNVDYVNGYASSFPSNRIVVFAHPPIDAPEIRNYDDWSRLVVTHELAHIFHLDRAGGIWRLGRTLLGRHPALFPNAYLPSWVIEGLAVYYESRVTGAGRLEGAEHYMISRAAAQARRIPRIGELSRVTSRFPGGEVVYAYGGQLFDYLSRSRGPDAIPRFVEVSSRVVLPLSLNRKAKRAFGISFENAWRDWRDSLERVAGPAADPVSGWRELTRDGRLALFPRWLGDTAIIYSGANGKDVTAAYSVSLDGRLTRKGRRNSLDSNVPRADGAIVFAQPDYIDAFHYRNDLWIERNGEQERLTRGARVSQPDVRADGEIVAVQAVPGSNTLVRVSRDGRSITPMSTATSEVQWAEPRWSPHGDRIAAVRVRRGGLNELVVMNESGSASSVIVSERAILSGPSWTPGGGELLYTSTRSGIAQAYRVAVSGGAPRRITSVTTGFFNPEVSPDADHLAGLHFRYDGYHVGVAPLQAQLHEDSTAIRGPRAGCTNCILAPIAPALSVEGLPPARRYSPFRSLLPTYWEPLFDGSSDTGLSFGAATSGQDIVGRHSYFAELLHNTREGETEGFLIYQYGGLGQPHLAFSASQEWEHFGIFDRRGTRVGDLARKARIAGLTASVVRPRARTFASAAIGAELESREYASDPGNLIDSLPPLFGRTRRYPSLFATAGWSNARRPPLSISREDGVSLSATIRQRWETGDFASASRSATGIAAAYKSLDLGGFAHHVIAVRGAAGFADRRAISAFSVGGLSGGSIDIVAGLGLGGERRTFGVRGFPPSAEQGTRALAGTIEYRAPVAAPSGRVRFVPLLFDRISVAAFADAGRAYCETSAVVCQPDRSGPWLSSLGAEIDFDTAVQYDVPARFRLGAAVPVAGRAAAGARQASWYFTVGSVF